MRIPLLSLLSLLSILSVMMCTACGGEQPEPAAPNKPKPVASAEPTPRCPASAPERPSDAQSKMEGLIGDIRKCYSLGTPGKSGGVVAVEITVAETGSVKGAKVIDAAGGHASAVECTENAMKKQTFEKFCGDDVSIQWKYPLQ